MRAHAISHDDERLRALKHRRKRTAHEYIQVEEDDTIATFKGARSEQHQLVPIAAKAFFRRDCDSAVVDKPRLISQHVRLKRNRRMLCNTSHQIVYVLGCELLACVDTDRFDVTAHG